MPKYPEIDPKLPIVALDFDGVLADSTWPDPALGNPINEGLDLLKHYYEQNAECIVFTARPVSHLNAIREWLEKWNLLHMVYDVTCMKPRASVYVDDRSWCPPWSKENPMQDDTCKCKDCGCDVNPIKDWTSTGWAEWIKQAGPISLGGDQLVDNMIVSMRHPSSQRFHEILKELGELHDAKSTGYGTDVDPLANVKSSTEWCVPAWVGAMVRANDKIRRLQSYAQKGELPFESVEDAFKDLAVYSVIGLVLFEQDNK